jgi:hypothetical protein
MKDFREEVTEASERQARHAKAIIEEIERKREEAEKKGMVFTALTPDQLQEKLRRTKSPMIVYQFWSAGAPPGGVINYSLGINNPDPVDRIWLFVHLFIGAANFAPNVNQAVSAVDGRFPRLTMPSFAGLTVKSGATEQLDFSIQVPAAVEKSNYLGNSFLFRSTWHDPGVYIDRSLFVFEVT